ncbi:hypothetical protein [Arsenophonus apicola]|uniref:Uncharacterized protein n=1 Tax=Arsenophonus apicola TaxID=2879119 RepID=A0ABY8P386_9GAMM|nr:hypothetical protein [Arsenophonus apicola]WGO83965.1 hypothetical protein QG404_03360 [Arsenophonus apicola]
MMPLLDASIASIDSDSVAALLVEYVRLIFYCVIDCFNAVLIS